MYSKQLFNNHGITMIELLIALFLTTIITVSAMSFYTSLHQQVLSQQEIADLQQLNRACLDELSTAVRSTGYGVPDTHPIYEEFTDSLVTYNRNDSGTIDTTSYYIEEFTTADYTNLVIGPLDDLTLYKLMKKTNSENAVEFGNFITELQITVISSKLLAITLETQASLSDETFPDNNGYRKFINTERVVVRNI